MSGFKDSERANPNTGLRSTRGGDSAASAPVPSSMDPHIVDAFSRLPIEDTAVEARANPSLGLRSAVGGGSTSFKTGIKSAHPAATASPTETVAMRGVQAAPGKPLGEQSIEFREAISLLPAGVLREVEGLLKDPGNCVSVEVDAAASAASIHNRNNGRLSTMQATWDASSVVATATSSPAKAASAAPVLSHAPGKAGLPASQTGGVVFGSSPGNAMVRQDKAFQEAVNSVPKPVQDRVAALLSDQSNHVFLDVNIKDGKVAIICKNGTKTSVTNASWIPGFSADHQYVPDAGPAQYKAVASSTAGSSSIAAASVSAEHAPGSAPPSTVGGEVFACIPGIPAAGQPAAVLVAFSTLPKALQDRITDLLSSEENRVYIDLNSAIGKAAIICKNGLKTSTLNASWNPNVHGPQSSSAATGAVIGTAHGGPHLAVRTDESVNAEDRANPDTGLRRVF